MRERLKMLFGRVATWLREFGSLTPLAFVTAVLPIAMSTMLLGFAVPLANWLRANPSTGAPLYVTVIVVACGLSLLPTNVIGLVGGFAFGFWLGIACLMTGIVCAATLSYLINRKITGDKLTHVFGHHPKAEAVYQALVGQSLGRTTLIIFLLRLSPAMPFALTNFLMSSAKVPRRAYIAGTFFGMVPRSSAVVLVGSGLSELRLDEPGEVWLLVFGIIATILSIVVITIFSRRALERLTGEKGI